MNIGLSISLEIPIDTAERGGFHITGVGIQCPCYGVSSHRRPMGNASSSWSRARLRKSGIALCKGIGKKWGIPLDRAIDAAKRPTKGSTAIGIILPSDGPEDRRISVDSSSISYRSSLPLRAVSCQSIGRWGLNGKKQKQTNNSHKYAAKRKTEISRVRMLHLYVWEIKGQRGIFTKQILLLLQAKRGGVIEQWS